jgi:hypothetical protein
MTVGVDVEVKPAAAIVVDASGSMASPASNAYFTTKAR